MIARRDVNNLEAYPVSRFPSLQLACLEVPHGSSYMPAGAYFGDRRLIQLLANRLQRRATAVTALELLGNYDEVWGSITVRQDAGQPTFWMFARTALGHTRRLHMMFFAKKLPVLGSDDSDVAGIVDAVLHDRSKRVVNGLYLKWWTNEALTRSEFSLWEPFPYYGVGSSYS